MLGGSEIVERLETLDEKERLYRYSAVNRQLPIANYTATLRVCDAGAVRAVLAWSGEFEPTPTIQENEAIKVVQDTYQAGFDNLKKNVCPITPLQLINEKN